ncbi:MAG TPA: GNAT family N-acetyltransferase [Phototrophicaceae bacterium]|nr:GNAT family N-acetyltransferase [Phototrophicaceae bacterium]
MLQFKKFGDHHPGQLFSLLYRSYADYLKADPGRQAAWPADWKQYDQDVFAYPDTVGKCGFVTWLDNQIIGFASWDPRQFPALGIIGHNCIVPEFRGNTFGKQQIAEILHRFQIAGFQVAQVTTNAHPFFVPAQRMYQACGFREVNRRIIPADPPYPVIDYELALGNS